MKRVPRRMTYRGLTRRPPWSWRPERLDGNAMRTCLTHQVDRIYYDDEAVEPLEIGRFDYLLRLYQHWGASVATVEHPKGVAFFEKEWQQVLDRRVEWLEYVNRHTGTTCRIAFGIAQRYGSWESTPRGYMWVVPIDFFTTSTRSGA